LDTLLKNMCYRVLVFGSSGVGKSSVINNLTGSTFRTINALRGCTFNTANTDPILRNGKEYIFYDTAGLNESDKGTVSAKDAINNLIFLLSSKQHGFNLLIMVHRGIILKHTEQNYQLFVKCLCDEKIPCICVVTGMEQEYEDETTGDWLKTNQPEFKMRGINIADVIPTVFSSLRSYANLRKSCANLVWTSIETHTKQEPYMVDKSLFMTHLRLVWNTFCEAVGLRIWVHSDSFTKLLQEMGLTTIDFTMLMFVNYSQKDFMEIFNLLGLDHQILVDVAKIISLKTLTLMASL